MSRATVSIRVDGTTVTAVSGTEPWRPRILDARDGYARIALVQSRASLIRADDVALSVEVAPGGALELVELGALLAHSVRGGAAAEMRAEIILGAGARLIWLGQPLIVGPGAFVDSTVDITLAEGARVLRGDAVVLGRAGAAPGGFGALRAALRVTRCGVPLIDELLDTSDPAVVTSPVVAGNATMIAAVTLAGARDDELEGVLQAHGEATLWRAAGATVETGAAAVRVAGRWRGRLTLASDGVQVGDERP